MSVKRPLMPYHELIAHCQLAGITVDFRVCTLSLQMAGITVDFRVCILSLQMAGITADLRVCILIVHKWLELQLISDFAVP